jgi:hypothetical protein
MLRAAHVLAALGLAGCALSAEDMKPSYISALQNREFNCKQVIAEMERVSRRAIAVAGVQDASWTDDERGKVAALMLSWPAFFVGKDSAAAAALARLNAEFGALQQTALAKNCDAQVWPQRQA